MKGKLDVGKDARSGRSMTNVYASMKQTFMQHECRVRVRPMGSLVLEWQSM